VSDGLKSNLKRLERLVQIRDTYVSVAESGVKQAESEVRRLETAERDVAGNIQHTQAEIAYVDRATAHDLQTSEKYIHALEQHRKLLRVSLEKATGDLEQRRREWTDAMREQKIVARLRTRRLHQWQHAADVAQQKSQDDGFIARFVRKRSM